MKNDKVIQDGEADSNEQGSAIEGLAEHRQVSDSKSRRGALGVLSKVTLGAWSLPIVTAVTAPAHAMMSDEQTTPAATTTPVVTTTPEPPELIISNAAATTLGGCQLGPPARREFRMDYDYVSEVGVVSHRFDLGPCAADEVELVDGVYEIGEEIDESDDDDGGSFYLISGDEFAGSIRADLNYLISGLDGLLACSLIVTITDAEGFTTSETVSVEECLMMDS